MYHAAYDEGEGVGNSRGYLAFGPPSCTCSIISGEGMDEKCGAFGIMGKVCLSTGEVYWVELTDDPDRRRLFRGRFHWTKSKEVAFVGSLKHCMAGWATYLDVRVTPEDRLPDVPRRELPEELEVHS